MRKIFLFATPLILLVSCIGGNKEKKVQAFANSFATYVNANQMDSIHAIYPASNFDSVSPIPLGAVSITENGNGTYRINFSQEKWIDVNVENNGVIKVLESKGIAAFPEDKYQTGLNTGMLNNSMTDTQIQELLNDEAYFEWLRIKDSQKGEYKIKVTPGKLNTKYYTNAEGWMATMTITVSNLSDTPISGGDYSISYKCLEWEGGTEDPYTVTTNLSVNGIDLAPNSIGQINLSRGDADKFYDFKIRPAAGREEVLRFSAAPSGNEYQEYLNSKK